MEQTYLCFNGFGNWDTPSSWKIGLIKLFPKVQLSSSLDSMGTYFLNGIEVICQGQCLGYKKFPTLVNEAQYGFFIRRV